MLQAAAAASVVPQVVVSAKFDAFVPPSVIPEILSVAPPLLVSVIDCDTLVVFGAEVKTRLPPDRLAVGATPVPLTENDCGDPVALSVTTTDEPRLPVIPGVNVTEMLQLLFAATELPQVLVCAKADDVPPLSAMLEIVSAALPLFVIVTDCAVEVVPTFVAVNVRPPGEKASVGAGAAVPVPFSVTVCGEPVTLSEIVTVAL